MEKLKAVRSPLKTNIDDKSEHRRIKMRSQIWSRESEELQTTTGLKQDDALSPILFNIVLDMAVREVQDEYQGINCGQELPLLAYADDVEILGESE